VTHVIALISTVFYLIFLAGVLQALWTHSQKLSKWLVFVELGILLSQLIIMASLLFAESQTVDWSDLFFAISIVLVVCDLLLRRRWSYPIISIVLTTMSLLCFLSSSVLMHLSGSVVPAPSFATYILHVIPATISLLTQFLVLACAGAILVFDRALKAKRAEVLFMPNPGLARLRVWLRLTLSINFLCWTLTILGGAFYALARQISFFSLDFVNLFSLVCWLGATLLFYQIVVKSGKILSLARYSLLFSALIVLVFVLKGFFLGTSVHSFVGI
jgi:hypothetical protein